MNPMILDHQIWPFISQQLSCPQPWLILIQAQFVFSFLTGTGTPALYSVREDAQKIGLCVHLTLPVMVNTTETFHSATLIRAQASFYGKELRSSQPPLVMRYQILTNLRMFSGLCDRCPQSREKPGMTLMCPRFPSGTQTLVW